MLKKGQYSLALYSGTLELWYSGSSPATKLFSVEAPATGKFLCFVQLPRVVSDGELRRFLAITDAKESFGWCVDFSNIHKRGNPIVNTLTVELLRYGQFPSSEDIHLVSAVDPMGWKATINTESLDVYTREVLVTLSRSGLLQTWTTNFSRNSSSLCWLNLSKVQTNIINASLVHGTSERKVAMGIVLFGMTKLAVNEAGNELTIWDTKVSRFSVHEEFRKIFPSEDVIRDLDWTSTPDSQSILAVGFPRRVVLFCQQRYNYLCGGAMWVSFMSFDMHKYSSDRL